MALGGVDAATQTWLLGTKFPLDGGINGLAASRGEAVWTSDYTIDPRIPHDPDDVAVSDRLGLYGMAAAPLRAPGGEVIGTLAISTSRPRSFDPEELDLLQGLADQAAITISNSNLERELRESETRFRNLVQTTPDVIYRCDADGRFLFVAEGAEALFGWSPAEISAMTFADLTAEESIAEAIANFRTQHGERDVIRRFRYSLRRRDGSTFPGEISSVAVWEDGEFAGVQGTVRDMSEQERLERELRESENRYRFLVENSPDVVYSTDAQGNFTFMSDAMERMTGWRPQDVMGGHFSQVVDAPSVPEAVDRWMALVAEPHVEQVAHLVLRGPDDRLVPVEVSAIGMVDAEGSFAGIHGSTRDISERARLERELRESEERYRYLVASSPDLVWVTDRHGVFTFISDASRTMVGREPAELIGRPFQDVFAPEAVRDATIRFRWVSRHPSAVHRMRLPFRHADGHDVHVEISGTGMTDDQGRFIGAHGAARDVSERDRLERHLRRQAGELASSEETGAPRPRAPRLGDPGALLDDPRVTVRRDAARSRSGPRAHAARPAARSPARGARRDARADLRAAPGQHRAGRSRPCPPDPHQRAPGAHRPADRGGDVSRSSAPSGDRGDALPDRPGGAPQHRQARRRPAGPARARPRQGRRSGCGSSTTAAGSTPTNVADGHLGLAGMRARAVRIGAEFTCESVPDEGTTIEVFVPDAALRLPATAPKAGDLTTHPRHLT